MRCDDRPFRVAGISQPATILLAPLMLLSAPLFLRHSWTYLDVDIVGATFVMLTVAACLLRPTRPSFTQSALVPGIFAGLAAASKYTLAIAVLPVLVAIDLCFQRRMISACALSVAATGQLSVSNRMGRLGLCDCGPQVRQMSRRLHLS